MSVHHYSERLRTVTPSVIPVLQRLKSEPDAPAGNIGTSPEIISEEQEPLNALKIILAAES